VNKNKTLEKSRSGNQSFHPVDSDEYKLVREIMDNYEWAYQQFSSTLNRLQQFQNTHDNQIDPALFPTMSKAALPLLYTMVKEQLPDTLEYLFPEEVKAIRMTPYDRDVDMSVIENLEWALHLQVLSRMKLKEACLPTLYDSFKAGLGYGAIEPFTYSPPSAINKRLIGRGGEVLGETRVMGVGQPVHSIRYRHIPLGQIIVTKDGNDFNGHNRVSYAFRFDTYSEDEFKRLVENEIDVEDIDLVEGVDADALIEQARTLGWHSRVPILEIQHALGGFDMRTRQSGNHNVKVRVPVLKVYTPTRHTWIANGTTIIYDKESTLETIHTPLVKASAAIDGLRWDPMSDAEASQTIGFAQNVWMNLMMDGAVKSVLPQGYYNKDVMDYPPEPSVQGMVGVSGPPQEHIYHPQPPQLNNAHFEFYRILDGMYNAAGGKRDISSNPQPGMLRAGLHAFESLMQTMSGRARLGASILQLRFLEPIFRQSLLYMQLFSDESGQTFALREYDQTTRKEGLKHLTVTHQDLMHGFDVELDLDQKKSGQLNFNERIQMWQQVYQGNPFVDQHEGLMLTIGNYKTGRRLLPSKEEARRMQDQGVMAAEAEQMGMAGQMTEGAGLM
jgi:hypothetical protein